MSVIFGPRGHDAVTQTARGHGVSSGGLVFGAALGSLRRMVDRQVRRSSGLTVLNGFLLLVVVGLAILAVTSPVSAQVRTAPSWHSGEAPDIAIVIEGNVSSLEAVAENLSGALLSLDGVSGVGVVPLTADTSVVYVSIVEEVEPDLLDKVETLATRGSGNVGVSILGVGAADAEFQRAIDREAALAVAFVILVASAVLALAYGWQVGLGTSLVLITASFGAALASDWLGVRFNGSLLSTSLPAVLASLVVVTMVGYRAVSGTELKKAAASTSWRAASFRAARRLGLPIVIMVAPLTMLWLVVSVLFQSSNPILSLLVGAVVGAGVGILLVPGLVQVGQVSFARPSERLRRLLRAHESARSIRLSLALLVPVIITLGVLNSFGLPSAADLDQGLASQSATSAKLKSGGDLTKAIALRAPSAVDPSLLDAYAAQLSLRPSVQLVQTGSSLASKGKVRSNEELGRVASFASLDAPEGHTLFVVPTGSARSLETQQLVLDVAAQNVVPGLDVSPVRLGDAQLRSRGGRLLVSIAILTSLFGAATALLIGGGVSDVFWFAAARLLILLSVVGLCSVLTPSDSVDEAVLLVLLTSLVMGLFEASYGVTPPRGTRAQLPGSLNRLTTAARLQTPIRSSSLGLGLLAMLGTTWMFADAPYLRPFGLASVVASVAVAAAVNVVLPAVHQGRTLGLFPASGSDALQWELGSLAPSLRSRVGSNLAQRGRSKSGAGSPAVRFWPASDSQSAPTNRGGLSVEDATANETTISADASGLERGPKPAGTKLSRKVLGFEELPVLSEPLADDPSLLSVTGLRNFKLAGEGGFAVVYSALDEAGKPVAVKLLTALGSPQEHRRFKREQEALSVLADVAGVVDLLSAGQTDRGGPYLVMPFFEGGTLAQRIRVSPLSWNAAHSAGCQLAETLTACHERGVYHRDLKPSNVLLDRDGRPYLVDFGSTQIADGRLISARSSFTPNYCPPEVLVDGNQESNGGLVDVYSLGALLWAMVTGRRPFVAEDRSNDMPTLFNRVATENLEPPEGVPEWFGEIISTAVAKEPSERFPSMVEMLTALTRRTAGRDTFEGPFVAKPASLSEKIGAAADRPGRASEVDNKSHPAETGNCNTPLTLTNLFARRSQVPEQLVKPEGISAQVGTGSSQISWRREVSKLVSADFDLASAPADYELDSVYLPGTDVYKTAQKLIDHYVATGNRIVGNRPSVLEVELMNSDAPVRLEILVRRPAYKLLNSDTKVVQHYPGELRRSLLWLAEADGGYRIAAIALRHSEGLSSER